MRLQVQVLRFGMGVALLSALWGCPSRGVDEGGGEGAGGVGSPCAADTDCDGTLCIGGVCSSPAGSSSSSAASSQGGGTSSGAGGSSAQASSGIPDAGTPDAYVPRGIIETNPATGPLEYGAQRIGQSVERTVTISNIGDAPFSVVQVGIRYAQGSVNAGEFDVVPVGVQPTSLPAGEQFSVRVVHTPVDSLPDNAFLSIVTTAANNANLELALVAEFKGDSTLAVHETPDAVGPNVQTVLVGAVAVGGSVTKSIYVRNLGAADSALTIQSAELSPATQTQFSVRAGPLPRGLSAFPGVCADATTCAAPSTACTGGLCVVEPGDGGAGFPLDAVKLDVTFQANIEGEASATLTLTGQTSGGPFSHVITLAAAAQSGMLSLEPNAIAFGEVFLNRTAERTLRLTNTGQGLLTVQNISWLFALPEFELVTTGLTFPRNIGPMGYVEVPVRFTPASTGGFNNMINVVLPNGTQTVQVTGTGALEPAIGTPDTVDFGNVYVGTSRQLPLVVSNTADGVLRINRAFVDAPGTTPFTFAPTMFTTPVGPNSPFTITVTYAPQLLNPTTPDTADLVIETNDPDLPLRRVRLTGRTVQPAANVIPSPTTLDFGVVLQPLTSGARTVQIRNLGVGDLTIQTDLVIKDATNTPRPEYVVTTTLRGQPIAANTPVTIAAGGGEVATFSFTFKPTQTDAVTASLRITTNDQALPTVDVTLVGSGGNCPARDNASVMVNQGTGACIYTCNANHHPCGDTCRADNDADACGASCTRCDMRAGADRTCSAGACAYSCQANQYDRNPVDLTVAQGQSSNGCEYSCVFAGNETCNDRDDNCNGSADEGLPADSPDPSNQCTSATNLGDVNDSDPDDPPNVVTYTTYTLYPQGDDDWFKIRAHELSTCFCISGTQTYEIKFELENIPEGRDYDLQVRPACGNTGASSTAGGNTSESITYTWYGGCQLFGGEDNQDFYIRVYPFGANSYACFPFRLKVSHKKIDC